MNEKVEIQEVQKDLEKSISDLQRMIVNYLEKSDHNKLLTVALINLEHKLLDDFYQLAKKEQETEQECEDTRELKLAYAQKAGKKETLH
jgi:hypothetical protein